MSVTSKARKLDRAFSFRGNRLRACGALILISFCPMALIGCTEDGSVSASAETSEPLVAAGEVRQESNGNQASVDELSSPSDESNEVSVTLHLSGVKSSDGSIRVAVFRSSSGFPNHEQAAYTQSFELATSEIADQSLRVLLDPVSAGSYSFAVYHDEDDSQALNKALIGYPTEPYGFSRDARSMTGPPAFSAAMVEVSQADREFSIRLR